MDDSRIRSLAIRLAYRRDALRDRLGATEGRAERARVIARHVATAARVTRLKTALDARP